MKHILLILFIIFYQNSFAQNQTPSLEEKLYPYVKNLDVILLPINCYSCYYIAKENHTEFSHSGVILKEKNKLYILQALHGVEKVPFNEFIKLKDPKRKLLVRRLLILKNQNIDLNNINNLFESKYDGLEFDHDYLWDNKVNGEESYYCSEFVTKFLNQFLKNPILPIPMKFDLYPDFWNQYFSGKTPEGELGFSPGDLERASEFYSIISM